MQSVLLEGKSSRILRVTAESEHLEMGCVVPVHGSGERFGQVLGILQDKIDSDMRLVIAQPVSFYDVFPEA